LSQELRRQEEERRTKDKRTESDQRQLGLKIDKIDLKFDSLVDKISLLEIYQAETAKKQELTEI